MTVLYERKNADRYTCPLTKSTMKEPMSASCCGAIFERRAILKCLKKNGNRCPKCGALLKPSALTQNSMLQWEILFMERQDNIPSSSTLMKAAPCVTRAKSSSSGAVLDTPPLMPRPPASLNERKQRQRRPETNNPMTSFRQPPKKSSQAVLDITPAMPPGSPSSSSSNPLRKKRQEILGANAEASPSANSNTRDHFRRVDRPPSFPKRSSPVLSSPCTKSVDSAPLLPRRSDSHNGIYDIFVPSQTGEAFDGFLNNESSCGESTDSRQKNRDSFILLLDDVLTVLSDADTF